jgi:hypothetical protein
MRHTLLIFKPILVIFVTLDAPRKGLQNIFKCSKAIDQCGENYKILFTKVFSHTCPLTIIKLQYVLL